MDAPTIEKHARMLVAHIADGLATGSLNTVTIAIYDTAWLSMVSRKVKGCFFWVFPQCFEFLLEQQLPSGGWESYNSKDDEILNTLAALLAMLKHQESGEHQTLLESRISKAVTYLRRSLYDWEVESSVHVGFEILVPAMLKMLEDENIKFDYPGQRTLLKLNAVKLKLFSAEVLYGETKTTLLHSLEAFIGKIDFDRVRHHKTFGSMMASPASTAAYLMSTSEWDYEAEQYLRKATREGSGMSGGGAPSVFPIPIFESSWVVSTLLQGGFSIESLGTVNLEYIASYLEHHFRAQDGTVGFAPTVQADADDTAKTILTLSLLGRSVQSESMLVNFKSKNGHLHTYPGERDPSFSANCNALRALLRDSSVAENMTEVSRVLAFLCDSWWSGFCKDKWNVTLQYPMMLLAEVLTQLLELWDNGHLEALLNTSWKHRVPIILIQIVNRTLIEQCSDGSWGKNQSVETTAYAILTLRVVSSLPWIDYISVHIVSAIQKGQNFLREHRSTWKTAQHLWIEKVTYGSSSLSEAYCLAAMRATRDPRDWSKSVKSLVQFPQKPAEDISRLFSSLEIFQSEPLWKIQACVLEGFLFSPQLKSARADILPSQKTFKNEYLNFIPCTWVIINNIQRIFLHANLLWDMMVLTLCNFRVDEYMETSMTKFEPADIDRVRLIIRTLCAEQDLKADYPLNHQLVDSGHVKSNDTSQLIRTDGDCPQDDTSWSSKKWLADVRDVLSPYIRAMLAWPRIQEASNVDRSHLLFELETFLLSHLDQLQDNKLFSGQPDWSPHKATTFLKPRSNFFTWAHTTGADSISCPFSFAFITCLVGSSGKMSQSQCFETVTQQYLAKDLCGRLAVMSRLYNDYGSLTRDITEGNLNGINFPEFHGRPTEDGREGDDLNTAADLGKLKTQLLDIAGFERQCADVSLERLTKALLESSRTASKERIVQALRLFTSVSELYADLYVARDLSNRVKAAS